MKHRGLVVRVLLVAALGALLAVPVVIVPLAQWISEDALRRTLRAVPGLVGALADDCARQPSGWRVVRPGTVGYGYDGASHRPTHPAAPPLDPTLLARLRAGEPAPSTLRWGPSFGGVVLVDTGRPGPCALLGLSWRPGAEASARHLRLVLALLVGLVFVSGLGALLFAIRPLRRRIARLEDVARHIGDPQRFRPIDDPIDDALGRLARRITESHHDILAAKVALDAHATALEEHLADVAHDVRTPLSALQLRLESLAGDRAGAEAHDARVLAALDDVLYLSSLAENLRLGNRLSDPVDRDTFEVDLVPIVRRVVDRFSALGALRAVTLRGSWPDAPVPVRCDPAAAEQALTNLVQNALVHGRRRGTVTVILERLEAGFELMVLDDGPGVPPEVLPRLAERRFRAGGARRRGAGSGLGLAIVAAVCDRSGWSLDFETLDPHGLRVAIRGPRVA